MEGGYIELRDKWGSNMSFDRDPFEEQGEDLPFRFSLGHQCGEWVIGDAEDMRVFIEDLQALLGQHA